MYRVALIACILLATREAIAAEKYALLIGVTTYEHAHMNRTPLKYPEADAMAVSELLQSSGYKVNLLLGKQATRQAIEEELGRLERQGTQEGVVFLGLFGHGVQYGDDAYFCPYDVNLRKVTDFQGNPVSENGKPKLEPDPQFMTPMSRLLEALNTTGASNRVLMADCCREDPSAPRGLSGRAFGSSVKISDLEQGTAAVFSCSNGEQAFEHDDWGHGAFTRAFLNYCSVLEKNSDATVSTMMTPLFRNVEAMVKEKDARKTQRLNPILNGIVDLKLRSKPAEQAQDAIKEIAKQVQNLLTAHGHNTVAIDPFKGPASMATSFGPGLEEAFVGELQRLEIQVKAQAELRIKGVYRLIEIPAEEQVERTLGTSVLAAEIEISVLDSFDEPLGRRIFKRQIRNESTVTQMAGLTVSLPTQGDKTSEVDRDAAVRLAVAHAPAHLDGSFVQSRPDSLYAMELLVRQMPRKVGLVDGLPFAEVRGNESYAIRLTNRSDFDAAVNLQIDGLSMFAFSEMRDSNGSPKYSTVLVPAGGDVTIRGWHINNETSDEFLVTDYPRSAAGQQNHATGIGTVTAIFHAAWDKIPPPDEPGKKRGLKGDATGRGLRIDEKFSEVSRQVGVVRDSISIRYTKPE